MKYFVTAINTDSGKTVVSAILTHALQADYWKPIQSGLPKDSDTVRNLIRSRHSLILEEAYLFKNPLSPHAAADLEGVKIELDKISFPHSDNEHLIIEGAGGVLAPLNDKEFVIDIAERFEAEVILVSNHYLGSINHTLLTINELKKRNTKVKGIVFIGEPNKYSEDYILKYSGLRCLLHIHKEEVVDFDMINKYALKLFENWDE